MTFEVEVAGRRRDVNVRRVEDRFEVTMDGSTREVHLTAAPSGWSLLIDGASYEVGVHEGGDATLVYVDGYQVPVVLLDGRSLARRRAQAARGRGNGPTSIVAPMPGRVVKVLVRPGDAVSPRQPLIVIEAMKMENELRAPAAGVVKEIRVGHGASVEAKAVLVVIE